MWRINDIKEIFHEPTKGELKEKIDNSQDFEESKIFLENLLKKLSENQLTDKEKNFLNNQIKEHIELQQLYKKYNKEKENLWDETKTNLNNLFQKDIISVIWEEDFDYINSQIENGQEKFNFFRENIKPCIEVKWEFEDIYETETTKFFINQFTVKYINFIDKQYNNCYKFYKNNDFNTLLLNKNDLDRILKGIIIKCIKKWIKLNKTIKFNILSGKQTINLKDFKNKVLLEIKIQQQEEEKEKFLKGKYNLWISLITWDISTEWLVKIQQILKTDIKDKKKLKILYIKNILLEENLITKEELLSFMEKEKQFNYLDFLHEFWLTPKVKKVGLELMKNIWINITEKNKYKLLYNLNIFTMFIVSMESDGYNVENFNNSWAEGYFQYKWNNFGKKKGYYSSFESALRRTSKYYIDYLWVVKTNPNNSKLKNPDWVVNAWKHSKEKWTVLKLSAEQQTILFLCDVFIRAYKTNRKTEELQMINSNLQNMLMNWNERSAEQLYKYIHHTTKNLDKKTRKRLRKEMKTFFILHPFYKKNKKWKK